jgi:putative PEP-CTERM system TPR-repeat lipoprotein
MKFTLKVFPVIVALALVGCSEPTPDEYIAEAQVKITQDQTPAAIILIKNAIQADPNNPEARYLLGKVYVDRGAAEAAEKELTRALELGYEPNVALPLLAKAYNLQYKNQQIIDLVDNAKNIDPVVETSLLLYQTLAYFALDKPAKAKQAVAIANEISAESIYSQLGSAYLSMSDKQLGDAIIKIETLLLLQPDLPEANLLKAQLATLNKDFAGAVKSFEKYYQLLPEVPQSRIFLAIAYIKNQQFELAEKHLDLLLKINSTQPFLNQLKGLVRYQDADIWN